jgi:hypothetical protein
MSKTFFKLQSTKVNLSSSFMARTICSKCGEAPDAYYRVFQPTCWQDPRSSQAVFDWYKRYIKQMSSAWYKLYQPSSFHGLKEFNFYWREKSYKPTLHQHKGIDQSGTLIEYLVCPCGKSVWAFAQKSVQTRPEIKNRKARYSYPRKFPSF